MKNIRRENREGFGLFFLTLILFIMGFSLGLSKYLQPDRQTYKLIDIKKLTDFLNNHPNYVPIRNIEDKFLVKKITK